MTPVVHILATCRNRALLPATLMVFDTIRVGFPNARIVVTINGTLPGGEELIRSIRRVDAESVPIADYGIGRKITHAAWIETLVAHTSHEPFWICDTDVVFHGKVEDWQFDEPMAGRYIPEFFCKFTNRITHARLHTSLMYFDPVEVLERMERISGITPSHPCKTPISFFAHLYYTQRTPGDHVNHFFFDTCAQLYHCIGGQRFTDEQNKAFDHLHCGTYSDLVEKAIPGISEKHRAVFANPALLKGASEHQDRFFQEASVEAAV